MSTSQDRPNILFVCTDQQSWNALGCVNDDLETPAMDRIVADGVRFNQAYCTNPICTPSRASLLTGRMPSQVGVRGNGEDIDQAYRDGELGRLFSEAGYDCGYAGKWHLGDDGIGPLPEATYRGFDRVAGFDDTVLAEECSRFLDEDRDAPFLLAINYDNPHNICEWSRDHTPPWGSIPSVPTEECPDLPANHAIPPYEPKIIRDTVEDHWAMGAMEGATSDEWRAYRHAYYRMVEMVDDGLGEILDALERNDLTDETLIVFTSDHGDMQGAHQLIQKTWFYEESARIPLLIRPPGGREDSIVDNHLVSNGLDLLPTFCDYANIPIPEQVQGDSLRAFIEGREPSKWRDYLIAETINDEQRIDGRMVRTEGWKYVVFHEGRNNEQLFDLSADPGELVDRSNTAAVSDILQAHRDHLLEWCAETGDQFGSRYPHPGVPFIPGYEWEEIAAYLDAHEHP